MSIMESRRDFLKKSSILIGSTAVLGSAAMFTGCAQQNSENVNAEVPTHPYEYVELDAAQAEKDGYDGYLEGGCCYGAFYAILKQLQEKVGSPYTYMSADMMRNGRGGYGAGSLCGAMGGAAAAIGLVCSADDSSAVLKKLAAWYTSTPIPNYQPEVELPKSVASSINCADSLSTFQKTAGIEPNDPNNKKRCGGLTADVAKKTVELLNVHFGFARAPVVDDSESQETELKENEYIGEAEGYGGPIKVKVTMDGDKIANIEVLSHGETAGISDPAFETIPDAIIAAQSTKVDVVADATYSSKGIMAAVEDALSKVGK